MIEYFTKRVAPNNTEYHFLMQTSEVCYTWISVTRIRPWYKSNEQILLRRMSTPYEGLEFFQKLLDSFPRDPLYKE